MSRINLSRIRKLETAKRHFTDLSAMTDEQLLEAACDYDPAVVSSVIPAFHAGGLNAGFEELYRVHFRGDPEKLAVVMEADRRSDCETVGRMLEESYARAI